MQLSIITPEKTLYSADADMVVIPGVEGDFGVLPGHAPFISALRPGIVTIDSEGRQHKIGVAVGFAEVTPERCTVLAEMAVDCEGLSPSDIQLRQDEARAAVAKAETDAERAAAQKKLAFAEALSV